MANRIMIVMIALFGAVVIIFYAGNFIMSSQNQDVASLQNRDFAPDEIPPGVKLETATFGTGCFWCSEAIFQQLKGVYSAVSGYSGGHVANPSYRQVCTGDTGHAEVVQVQFDPKVISYKELLEVFWKTHDPTTLNRQGADVGTQYRSAIFYHNEEQKQLAEHYKAELNKSGAFDSPIVTEITKFEAFYAAEDYHQNYYALQGSQPYCSLVIRPKLDKFRKVFADKLKTARGK